MTMKLRHFLYFCLAGLAVPASGQVIEIDDRGNSQTFDQPTVFSDFERKPIRTETRKGSAEPFADIDRTISDASREHGVDRGLLLAMIAQESGGNSRAVSLRGARGLMQLMPGTAAELGVRIDDVSDNIHGGAMYLRRQIDRFGSVPLALAAYNSGPGAVLRFGGIPPYRETRDYVARIIERWHPGSTPRIQRTDAHVTVLPTLIEVPAP